MSFFSAIMSMSMVLALLVGESSCQSNKCSINDISCTNDDVFSFILGGLSDNLTVPWGINTYSPHHSNPAHFIEGLFAITFNNTLPSSAQNAQEPVGSPIIVANVSNHTTFLFPILAEIMSAIALGPTWASYSEQTNRTDINITTVPVGFNLGRSLETNLNFSSTTRSDLWSGSVILGNYYDAGRIDTPEFIQVARANEFLNGGRFSVENVSYNQSTASATTINETVIFDLNSEFVYLPKIFSCNSDLSIHFEDAVFDIVIPAYLLRPRCQNILDGPGIMGRPFFQAAYTVVGINNNVYFAQAHNRSNPIIPKSFSFSPNGADYQYSASLPATGTHTATNLVRFISGGISGATTTPTSTTTWIDWFTFNPTLPGTTLTLPGLPPSTPLATLPWMSWFPKPQNATAISMSSYSTWWTVGPQPTATTTTMMTLDTSSRLVGNDTTEMTTATQTSVTATTSHTVKSTGDRMTVEFSLLWTGVIGATIGLSWSIL
jgi:hypothetical protein